MRNSDADLLAARSLAPGGKTLLEADAVHQILPFLTELRRHLVNGESLFYSFSGGLGYNFWSTIAYYGASPLNLMMTTMRF